MTYKKNIINHISKLLFHDFHFSGKAQTAAVKRDAEIGVAQVWYMYLKQLANL